MPNVSEESQAKWLQLAKQAKFHRIESLFLYDT